MELSTFIKLIFLLTIFIGYIILSAKSKSLTSSRNNCRCGEINSPHRITGGTFTKPNAYPWQAMILLDFEDMCGGTVINNMYILSAAHCVVEEKKEDIRVALGVHDKRILFNNKGPYYKVVDIIIHENYNDNRTLNDIAILKVNKRIKFNKIVKSICLLNQYEQIVGKRATVIGWGLTKYEGPMSNTLKETTVEVWKRKRCLRALGKDFFYTMFCASGGIHDACQGDSGGPIFYTNDNGKAVQIGIVSTGDNCGKTPGIYTKLSIYLDWIHKKTKDATYCKRKM